MYILLMDEVLSGFFCDVNQTQKNRRFLAFTDLLGNRRSWLVFLIGNFDPFCVFLGSLLLNFRVRSRVFGKRSKFYLSSKFIFFILKHNKFRLFL